MRPRLRAIALLVAVLLAGLPGEPGASRVAAASTDPDGDGLPTTFELTRSKANPYKADTDGDGIRDGSEDPDHAQGDPGLRLRGRQPDRVRKRPVVERTRRPGRTGAAFQPQAARRAV
jgi:hypothetical protein